MIILLYKIYAEKMTVSYQFFKNNIGPILLQSMFYHIIQDNLNNDIHVCNHDTIKEHFKLLMYNNIIWIYHVHRLPHMYICWKREKCVIFLKIALWKYDHQCQYVFKHTIKQEAGENQFFILKTILWTAISLYF